VFKFAKKIFLFTGRRPSAFSPSGQRETRRW